MMHIKRQLLGVTFLLVVLLQSGCASMLPTGGKDTLQSS